MKKKSHAPIPDERLELLFRHAGLSEKQAKLYRMLVIDGQERVSTLSRKTGIKRGNTYALLRDLRARGLITEFEKDRIVYFRPEPPERLTALIEARKKDAEIADELATDLIPGLNRQYTLAVGKPTIRYFEGQEGIHDVFTDIYAPKKEPVWGCVDLEVAGEAFPEHITKTLMPLRIKHNVFAYSLVADSPASRSIQSVDSKQLRETVLVDKKNHPLPGEIDVYEDKIAMLSFEKGKFIGILIQNQVFATTLKSVFELAFAARKQKNQTTSGPQISAAPQLSEIPG